MATPEEMAAKMVANLKEKTGKTLPQWLKLAAKAQAAKHGELVKHLKAEHGLTHGYANLVAHEHFRAAAGGGADDPVAAQYSGKKEALRPIYDKLVQAVAKLGRDAELSPKKSYVSLRRSVQFGLIQPSTATRVDVGLNLKGVPPDGRLEAAGSWNGMVTHRVRVSSPNEVDAQLKRWLKQAYEAS